MGKKFSVSMLSLLLALVTLGIAGCGSTNPSETSYWFSSAKTEFIKYVEYSDEKDNLSEAGNYWYFTSAKDMDIEMYLITDAYDMYSTTYLYVNDTQVQSEVDTGIYTFVYKLSLKRGDKIKIHAFWTNRLKTDEKGFEMQLIGIRQNGQTYILSEYDKTK